MNRCAWWMVPALGAALLGCQPMGPPTAVGGRLGTRGPSGIGPDYPAFSGLDSSPASAAESAIGPEPLKSFLPEDTAPSPSPVAGGAGAAPANGPGHGPGAEPTVWPPTGKLAPAVRPPSETEPPRLPDPRSLDEWLARVTDAKKREYLKAALHASQDDPITAVDLLQKIPEKDRDLYTLSLLGAVQSRLGNNAGAQATYQQIERMLDRALPLEAGRAALCETVDGFGEMRPFPRGELKPGRAVLLYFEPVHLTQAPEPDGGYTVWLNADCRVFTRPAAGGSERQEVTWDGIRHKAYQHTAPVYRRDLWLQTRVEIPRDLPPGAYTLELTLEDVEGKKNVTTAIPFELR